MGLSSRCGLLLAIGLSMGVARSTLSLGTASRVARHGNTATRPPRIIIMPPAINASPAKPMASRHLRARQSTRVIRAVPGVFTKSAFFKS